MMKSLRKYNKWILVVGGSILIISFLFTGTSQMFQPDPGKRVVATLVGGEAILGKDRYDAERALEALKATVPNLVNALGVRGADHWFLLVREAERAGLVGHAGDGVDWIPELAQAELETGLLSRQGGEFYLRQLRADPARLKELLDRQTQVIERARAGGAGRAKIGASEMDLVLARLRGVTRLMTSLTQAARLSDRQALAEVRKLIDRAVVDAVVIPASALAAEVPEPTPAEMQAHFDRYRAVKPGEGEHGFGYVQPDKVKLEWMRLDRAAIAAAIPLDPVAVNVHWRQNRARYAGEFAAERAVIEADLREARLTDILSDIDRVYKAKVRAVARQLPADGTHRALPADWASRRPSFEALAQTLADEIAMAGNVRIPTPSVESTSGWMALPALTSLPGVGGAVLRLAAAFDPIDRVVASVRELTPASTSGLQVGLPFEAALQDDAGDLYFITVLDVRPSQPAESLDEVRDEVIRDLRRLGAFERLRAESPTYAALAASDGVEAVGRLFAKPAEGDRPAADAIAPRRYVGISRSAAGAGEGPLQSDAVRDAVMTAADRLGPLTAATPENAADRTVTVPVPSELSLCVVQILGQEPIALEDMRTFRSNAYGTLLRRELDEATGPDAEPAFGFERVKARAGYATRATEEDEDLDRARKGATPPAAVPGRSAPTGPGAPK